MEFMTQKEYKLRELLQDGRIERTAKNRNSWNIPVDTLKPVDKRIIKLDYTDFMKYITRLEKEILKKYLNLVK